MITVVNKHHGHHADWKTSFFIGRGSALGNPYTHLRGNTSADFLVSTREEAIAGYKDWLIEKIANRDPDVCNALNRILLAAKQEKDVELICFCKPKACHGDVIKAVIEERLHGRTQSTAGHTS